MSWPSKITFGKLIYQLYSNSMFKIFHNLYLVFWKKNQLHHFKLFLIKVFFFKNSTFSDSDLFASDPFSLLRSSY